MCKVIRKTGKTYIFSYFSRDIVQKKKLKKRCFQSFCEPCAYVSRKNEKKSLSLHTISRMRRKSFKNAVFTIFRGSCVICQTRRAIATNFGAGTDSFTNLISFIFVAGRGYWKLFFRISESI